MWITAPYSNPGWRGPPANCPLSWGLCLTPFSEFLSRTPSFLLLLLLPLSRLLQYSSPHIWKLFFFHSPLFFNFHGPLQLWDQIQCKSNVVLSPWICAQGMSHMLWCPLQGLAQCHRCYRCSVNLLLVHQRWSVKPFIYQGHWSAELR